MAKSKQRIIAKKLRNAGNSIKDIARILAVSQSTVSLWCRDIKLSQKQLNKILDTKRNLITRGRMKGAMMQKQKRIQAIREATQEAKRLNKLTDNEFFVTGLALYLAEGTKTYGTVQFTNSDKRIVKFMVNWFNHFFNIQIHGIKCSIHINTVHKSRGKEIIAFWRRYLKLKSGNFTDIRYVKTPPKKIYDNHNKFYGTMDLRIRKSTNLLYRINALTDRLLILKNS